MSTGCRDVRGDRRPRAVHEACPPESLLRSSPRSVSQSTAKSDYNRHGPLTSTVARPTKAAIGRRDRPNGSFGVSFNEVVAALSLYPADEFGATSWLRP